MRAVCYQADKISRLEGELSAMETEHEEAVEAKDKAHKEQAEAWAKQLQVGGWLRVRVCLRAHA